MTPMMVDRAGESAPVVDAVRRSWAVHGETSDVRSWAQVAGLLGLTSSDEFIKSVVVIPRLRVMECVLDMHTDIESAVTNLTALVNAGWKVDALLPVRSLGEAHEVFRGLAIRLQGWFHSTEGVKFTSLETP